VKPYYQDGSVSIYHGDMRELVAGIDRVDAVVADPPYGETRLKWDRWPKDWPKVLLGKAPQLWCFGSFRLFLEKLHEFDGWIYGQDLVWEKHNGSALHTDRFRKVHEFICHFYTGKWNDLFMNPPVTFDAQKRKIRRQQKPDHWGQLQKPGIYEMEENGPRLMRSVLFFKSTHREADVHSQKPEGLIRPLLTYSIPPGGCVLDPFLGSGTVLRVAKDMGFRGIGFEQDEEHCEIAAKRMEQEVLIC